MNLIFIVLFIVLGFIALQMIKTLSNIKRQSDHFDRLYEEKERHQCRY